MKRFASLLGLLALAASVIAACGGGPVAAKVGSIKSDGSATIGGRPLGKGSTPLHAGDDIIVNSGTATLRLADGGELELRDGSALQFAAAGPTLESGGVLVQSPVDAPVDIQTSIGVVTVQGVARVNRDLAVEVGTYSGEATVAAQRDVTIPQLEEDTIPAVGLVPDPSPLEVDAADPWDEQFVGLAIDLTTQLDGQSTFVTANTPTTDAGSVAFYRRTLPGLGTTPTFTAALLHTSAGAPFGEPPAGVALVAAAIALSGPGSFLPRWQTAFQLWTEGAQWGIIALDEDANPTTLLGLVGDAVARASLAPPTPVVTLTVGPPLPVVTPVVAAAPAKPAPKPVVPTSHTSHPAPSAPTTTTTAPPAATPTATTSLTTPPSGNVLAPILNPVLSLVHHLLP